MCISRVRLVAGNVCVLAVIYRFLWLCLNVCVVTIYCTDVLVITSAALPPLRVVSCVELGCRNWRWFDLEETGWREWSFLIRCWQFVWPTCHPCAHLASFPGHRPPNHCLALATTGWHIGFMSRDTILIFWHLLGDFMCYIGAMCLFVTSGEWWERPLLIFRAPEQLR